MRISILVLSLFAVLTPALSHADISQGKDVYGKLCASCHGPEGKGDGPIAAAMPPEQKPRNFVEGHFKVATDDTKMKEVIKKGGAAFGMSPLMAPQASLNDTELASVVEFVRSLKK